MYVHGMYIITLLLLLLQLLLLPLLLFFVTITDVIYNLQHTFRSN